jgi:hypothetical protein
MHPSCSVTTTAATPRDVCGGSGDSRFDAAAAAVELYRAPHERRPRKVSVTLQ